MSTWELLAGLPLEIERYTLEPLQADVSSDFVRKSTVIHLHGGGHEGVGEDVTYDAVDQEILQAAGPALATPEAEPAEPPCERAASRWGSCGPVSGCSPRSGTRSGLARD